MHPQPGIILIMTLRTKATSSIPKGVNSNNNDDDYSVRAHKVL